MKQLLFMTFICLATVRAAGQSITLDEVEISGNKVIVHYSLQDQTPGRQYLVNLFTSTDNFRSPLTKVLGDVGTEVKSGTGKKITWDITRELGAFKGDLAFEVRGRVFVPFVKLIDFDEHKVFKRGRNYPITWTSGNLSGQVNIELFRDQERIMGENNAPNSGKYDLYIPASIKKGNNYRLKFTNTKDRNDIQLSKPFTIKPKIPFIVKALGVMVVGGGIYFLTRRGGGNEGNTPQKPEDPLPENPGVPK